MLELLSPAGSREAVTAAVQNGAPGALYLGFGDYNARRNAKNFTPEQFAETVEYCPRPGHQGLSDPEHAALGRGAARRGGAGALCLRRRGGCGAGAGSGRGADCAARMAPDLPLHASTQMSHPLTLDGAKAARPTWGCTRVVLSPGAEPGIRSRYHLRPFPSGDRSASSTAPCVCATPASASSPPSSAAAAATGACAPSPAA